jgi:hypothetical protein
MSSRRVGLLGRLLLVALVGIYGCDAPPGAEKVAQTRRGISVFYADPREQQEFRSALLGANIPFTTELREGNEYIVLAGRYDDEAKALDAKLFGPPLPEGRHVSLDPASQEKFKRWLSSEGIVYTTQVSRGREFIVWSEADMKHVRESPFARTASDGVPNPTFQRTAVPPLN